MWRGAARTFQAGQAFAAGDVAGARSLVAAGRADMDRAVMLQPRTIGVLEIQGRGATPFLFLGRATYMSHRGERPMAVTWHLETPLPTEFFQAARAVA